MKTWCVPAFAKINIGLRILGKRPDEFHELETYLLQIDLADRLFFEKSELDGFELTCNCADLPVDAANLCWRAYELICSTVQRRLGVRLHLEKNIPVGAGLGGGSSDAAVTLMALNQLCDLNISDAALHDLATQLGSDVPFFLTGGLCWGSGRGEIITPLPELPNWEILLVTPAVVVSTAWAYQNYKMNLTNRQKITKLPSSDFVQLQGHQLAEVCQNDLENVVFEKHPELAELKLQLQQAGAVVASMTGSGSALFGLFRSRQEAQRGQQLVSRNTPVFLVRPVRWGIRQVYRDYCAAVTSEGRSSGSA
jgi:4-diphosphocytidyl-2-C-methyl-D-erythritol kinase